MNATEKDNVFYCDCGFSWRRGMSGSHRCEDGLRRCTDGLVTGFGSIGIANHFRPTNRPNAITCLARYAVWIYAVTSKRFMTACW